MRKLLWQFDAAGASVISSRAVAHVSPAFQKHAPAPVILQNLKSTFQPNKIAPRLACFTTQPYQRFHALPRSAHQLLRRRRRRAHSTLHFQTHDLEVTVRNEFRRKRVQSFRNGPKLWLASAANGNDDLFHERNKMKKQRRADSNGNRVSIPRGIHQPEEILKNARGAIWTVYYLSPESRLACRCLPLYT